MNKFFGNYRGFVLNNTDPSKAGRVKVWVPAVHGRNYSIYNENDPQVIGGLSQAEINDHLRNTPWADVAQSLVGGGGSSAQYDGAGFTVGDGFQTGGGQIPIKSNGRVDPEQLRGYLINQIKGSQLVGVIPSDGAKFNIDGSAESWANLFTALCKNESNYKTTGTGDAGRFKSKTTGLVGSHGLFQLSADDALNHKLQSTAFTLSELQDPAINTKATIAIASRLISQHNVIAGGSSQGLSRYWGPLRRGEVNVPPVPPYRPTSPNNQSLVSVDTDILTPNTPTKKQKPAQAFSPSSNGYKVTNDTREVYGGSSVLRKQGRPISLDFNSAGGNAGIFIVVPFDVTQQERDYCMQYVNACSNFFNKYSKDPKSKNISSNPIRRGGTSENPRGIKGFFHTEAWDQDGSAMQSIIDNPQEYANILASTLGKIPNALFLPPHKVNAQGTEFKPTNSIKNVSETEFAKKYIIPFLGGANGGLVVDAFSSVGNKHPEQNRDEQFLLKLGIEQSKIDELTKIGKQLYTTTSRAKSDISGRYDSEIEELKTARDKFWDNLELDEDKFNLEEKSLQLLSWKPEHNIGIEEADRQHKKMLDMMNEVHVLSAQNHSNKSISRALDILITYTEVHFEWEEKFFDSYQYPKSQEHKKHHSLLIQELRDHQKNITIGDQSAVTKELSQLNNWLIEHIKHGDRDYASYLSNNEHFQKSRTVENNVISIAAHRAIGNG